MMYYVAADPTHTSDSWIEFWASGVPTREAADAAAAKATWPHGYVIVEADSAAGASRALRGMRAQAKLSPVATSARHRRRRSTPRLIHKVA